ncbi:MAG: T9SS type A sorting domain-containing protein [Bacteroidota bacterium]
MKNLKTIILVTSSILISFTSFSQVPGYVPNSGLVAYNSSNGNIDNTRRSNHVLTPIEMNQLYLDCNTTSTISPTVCGSYTAPDGAVYTTSGTQTAIIPNGAGCDSTITINLTVNPIPTAHISGTNTICRGSSTPLRIDLTGTAPWSVTIYNGLGSQTISHIWSSPFISNVTPLVNRTYTITAISDTNCTGTSMTGSAVITVKTLPTSIIAGNSTICAGDTANLTIVLYGSQPWNLTYTDGTTPANITGITSSPYILKVVPAITSTFTITAISDAFCTGTSMSGSAVVTLVTAPTAQISGTDTICVGQTTTLNVNLTGTSPWNLTYTNGTTPQTVYGISSSPYMLTVFPTATSTYTLTDVYSGCSGLVSGSGTITVNALPTSSISGPSSICVGDTATISIALTGTPPWDLIYTNGTTNDTVTGITSSPYTFLVAPTTPKIYVVTSLSDTNCNGVSLTGSVALFVNPLPVVSISGLNTFYCVYDPAATLTGNPAGGTFSGTGISGNIFDPNAAGEGTFDIIYTYTDGNNCTNSDTNTVVVDLCIGINNINATTLSIYPNPSTGSFTLQLDESASIEIYSAQGSLVYSEKFESGKRELKFDVAEGVYLLKASNAKGSINHRIVIQK